MTNSGNNGGKDPNFNRTKPTVIEGDGYEIGIDAPTYEWTHTKFDLVTGKYVDGKTVTYTYGNGTTVSSSAARGANIPRGSLNPTNYITKSKMQMKALLNEIRLNGIQEPIKYVEHNGIKYIVDGYYRFYAAQRLGIQNVPVEQVSLLYAGYKSTMDLILEPGKHPGYWNYIK